MNKEQIIRGIYDYLLNKIENLTYELIIENDIRVENFFAINIGIYLKELVKTKKIKSFNFQHTVLLIKPKRIHIDITFTDLNNKETFLELKHFSISGNRGKGRKLNFYTSNSFEGKKLGIVGDCEKFDSLTKNGIIKTDINKICCAIINPKPSSKDINSMIEKFKKFPELENWQLKFPIDFEEQHPNIGFFILENIK